VLAHPPNSWPQWEGPGWAQGFLAPWAPLKPRSCCDSHLALSCSHPELDLSSLSSSWPDMEPAGAGRGPEGLCILHFPTEEAKAQGREETHSRSPAVGECFLRAGRATLLPPSFSHCPESMKEGQSMCEQYSRPYHMTSSDLVAVAMSSG
jgi:hypothetical protein